MRTEHTCWPSHLAVFDQFLQQLTRRGLEAEAKTVETPDTNEELEAYLREIYQGEAVYPGVGQEEKPILAQVNKLTQKLKELSPTSDWRAISLYFANLKNEKNLYLQKLAKQRLEKLVYIAQNKSDALRKNVFDELNTKGGLTSEGSLITCLEGYLSDLERAISRMQGDSFEAIHDLLLIEVLRFTANIFIDQTNAKIKRASPGKRDEELTNEGYVLNGDKTHRNTAYVRYLAEGYSFRIPELGDTAQSAFPESDAKKDTLDQALIALEVQFKDYFETQNLVSIAIHTCIQHFYSIMMPASLSPKVLEDIMTQLEAIHFENNSKEIREQYKRFYQWDEATQTYKFVKQTSTAAFSWFSQTFYRKLVKSGFIKTGHISQLKVVDSSSAETEFKIVVSPTPFEETKEIRETKETKEIPDSSKPPTLFICDPQFFIVKTKEKISDPIAYITKHNKNPTLKQGYLIKTSDPRAIYFIDGTKSYEIGKNLNKHSPQFQTFNSIFKPELDQAEQLSQLKKLDSNNPAYHTQPFLEDASGRRHAIYLTPEQYNDLKSTLEIRKPLTEPTVIMPGEATRNIVAPIIAALKESTEIYINFHAPDLSVVEIREQGTCKFESFFNYFESLNTQAQLALLTKIGTLEGYSHNFIFDHCIHYLKDEVLITIINLQPTSRKIEGLVPFFTIPLMQSIRHQDHKMIDKLSGVLDTLAKKESKSCQEFYAKIRNTSEILEELAYRGDIDTLIRFKSHIEMRSGVNHNSHTFAQCLGKGLVELIKKKDFQPQSVYKILSQREFKIDLGRIQDEQRIEFDATRLRMQNNLGPLLIQACQENNYNAVSTLLSIDPEFFMKGPGLKIIIEQLKQRCNAGDSVDVAAFLEAIQLLLTDTTRRNIIFNTTSSEKTQTNQPVFIHAFKNLEIFNLLIQSGMNIKQIYHQFIRHNPDYFQLFIKFMSQHKLELSKLINSILGEKLIKELQLDSYCPQVSSNMVEILLEFPELQYYRSPSIKPFTQFSDLNLKSILQTLFTHQRLRPSCFNNLLKILNGLKHIPLSDEHKSESSVVLNQILADLLQLPRPKRSEQFKSLFRDVENIIKKDIWLLSNRDNFYSKLQTEIQTTPQLLCAILASKIISLVADARLENFDPFNTLINLIPSLTGMNLEQFFNQTHAGVINLISILRHLLEEARSYHSERFGDQLRMFEALPISVTEKITQWNINNFCDGDTRRLSSLRRQLGFDERITINQGNAICLDLTQKVFLDGKFINFREYFRDLPMEHNKRNQLLNSIRPLHLPDTPKAWLTPTRYQQVCSASRIHRNRIYSFFSNAKTYGTTFLELLELKKSAKTYTTSFNNLRVKRNDGGTVSLRTYYHEDLKRETKINREIKSRLAYFLPQLEPSEELLEKWVFDDNNFPIPEFNWICLKNVLDHYQLELDQTKPLPDHPNPLLRIKSNQAAAASTEEKETKSLRR